MGAATLFVHNMSIFSGYRKIMLGVLRQIIVKVGNTLFKGSANKRQITIITNLFII